MKEKQSITKEEFEIIEKYINNAMTAEEQKAFIDKISSDPSLQQKVNEVRTLIDGVEASALKNKLDDFHKELPQTHSKVLNKAKLIQKPKRSKIHLYAIAAVLVVVFGILWFFNSADSNQRLFAEHFTLNYFLGVAYLAEKKEREAIDYLTEVSNTQSSMFLQESYYYLGLALLKSGEIEKAKTNFEKSNNDESQTILKELNK